MFKCVKGKDGTTSFLLLDGKPGGKISYIKNREAMCLSEKQANYIYKKIEGKVINTDTMKNDIEQEIDGEDDNPYKICFKYSKNPGRKWTVCWCIVCNSSNYGHTWT